VQNFQQPSSQPHIQQFSDLDGQWRVIFFGYMYCPDFCPLTLVDYRDVRRELTAAEAEQISFIFISVDAARDTPEKLQTYLANFDPTFVGFPLDDATLTEIQPEYGFYYKRQMREGSQAVYTVDHSTRSYLVDPQGYLRASFAYDTDPKVLAEALRWYMAHSPQDKQTN
jgi:protein SCO1/2